jgi:phosphoesterase family protein
MSTVARGFATFDHWFCDVPTCTFPNRSFFHAGTSSGFVINWQPADAFPGRNTAETLFDRLDAAGLTWRIYCDPPCHASLTGIIHAARLRPKFATNIFSTAQFFEDAASGNLPTYSFIEPQVIGYAHNDMHPPFGYLFDTVGKARGVTNPDEITADPPSSLIAGEELLAGNYTAIRAGTADGSTHLNTTLLVTFDEHGGTYDHVPPPAAVPPSGQGTPGQMDFTFNRSGIRIPTLAISAWIPERTWSPTSTGPPPSSPPCASGGTSARRSPPERAALAASAASSLPPRRATRRTGPTWWHDPSRLARTASSHSTPRRRSGQGRRRRGLRPRQGQARPIRASHGSAIIGHRASSWAGLLARPNLIAAFWASAMPPRRLGRFSVPGALSMCRLLGGYIGAGVFGR